MAAKNIKRFLLKIAKEEYERCIGYGHFLHEVINRIRKVFLRWKDFDGTGVFLNNISEEL